MDAPSNAAPATSPGARSSDSDISPMTQVPDRRGENQSSAETTPRPRDYFPAKGLQSTAATADSDGQAPTPKAVLIPSGGTEEHAASTSGSSSASGSVAATSKDATTGQAPTAAAAATASLDLGDGRVSRKSSYASVSFCPNKNPALPQGTPKQARIRSPAPTRFRKHVGFDNIPLGEVTKSNTLGYTLSVSHYGYHPRRRSRTMMVGIDQNMWSDFALQWLLEEYADDGDEVICVHVIDKDARTAEVKNYKAKADQMVERIKRKIPEHCAISITLEYAVGKLHDTFQKLIQVYQPSMLVVGTRGRSLGGFQGLVNTNSFSKYCLQYSPIPTVVVRDSEKRIKKKEKRSADPSRHSYAAMLAATHGVHEANSETSSVYDMEARLSPDEEAHRVAAAIGLPAAFDPTLMKKVVDMDQYLGRRSRANSPSSGLVSRSPTADVVAKSPLSATSEKAATLSVDSEDEDSGLDDEAEFEVTSGQAALASTEAATESRKVKQKKLHMMEVGEAAALKHNVESDEEDEEEKDTAKTEAETAKTEAETAKTEAETAKTEAETAQAETADAPVKTDMAGAATSETAEAAASEGQEKDAGNEKEATKDET